MLQIYDPPIYWTIKYTRIYQRRGRTWKRTFFLPHCAYSRKEAIKSYLADYKHGSLAGKDWRWHRRNQGVSVVKIRFMEIWVVS